MNWISLSQPTIVTQVQEPKRKLFFARCGVVFGSHHASPIWSKLSWTPAVGLIAMGLHPAVASTLGPHASKMFAALAIALLLPACRKIVVAPFVAILVTSVLIGLHNRSITAVAIAIPAYAIFHMIVYDTARFHRAILIVALIAGLLALLQFFSPSRLLNIHATAESWQNFLDQYRPTSIFPSQAYHNQLLLLLIPLFFLAGEKRIWVLALAGFSAAITGSTAGLFFVALSLLLGGPRTGCYVVAGFGVAIVMMATFYPERLMYNFSLGDQIESISSRTYGSPDELARAAAPAQAAAPVESAAPTQAVAPAKPAAPAQAGIVAGHPILMIAIQVAAICGLLLASMMAVRMRIPLLRLLPICAAILAIIAGQMIHPTMGSLYSSLTLAVLAAIIWNFVRRPPSRTARVGSEPTL